MIKQHRQLIIKMLLRSPGMMIAAMGLYLGLAMIFLGTRRLDLIGFLHQYGWIFVGGIILAMSFGYMMLMAIKISRKEERFIDVDDKRNSIDTSFLTRKLINEIEQLKKSQPDIDYAKIEDLIKKATVPFTKMDPELVKSFENYFNGIRSTLEEKASMADAKASILLDKGTSYSLGGIVFFVISIISWQVLSWFGSFKPQFIYGIVSCSVLFIFIEFLSAWFLKQYRQFVDTSTYLIKVKSIFDKYMLAYLVLKESSGEQKDRLTEMLEFLREEIKWPDTYLLKNGDISFAKETMESMTCLVKALREMNKTENK